MALSYNSTNVKKEGRLAGLSLRTLLMLVVVGVSFGAGFVGRQAYAAYPVHQADKTCRNYLSLVFSGKLDEAYKNSSDAIKSQKVEDFKASLSGLNTNSPKYTNSDVQLIKDQRSRAVCSYVVDGLPKTADGRTDAVFTIGVNKGKVDSVVFE